MVRKEKDQRVEFRKVDEGILLSGARKRTSSLSSPSLRNVDSSGGRYCENALIYALRESPFDLQIESIR